MAAIPGLENAGGAAIDINDLGAIVGFSSAVGPGNVDRAFYWTESDGPKDLGALEPGGMSLARALTNGGAIVGESELGGQRHAVLWANPNAPPQDLGTLGGAWSRAEDVNDAGTIVGESPLATGQVRGFRRASLGPLVALSTLGGDSSRALGINTVGHIVGSATLANGARHAVAWWVYFVRDALVCTCRFPTAAIDFSTPKIFPVTILGTRRRPVSEIDLATVTLGNNDGNETPIVAAGRVGGAVADRNHDGFPDLVVHFDQAQLIANGDLTPDTRVLWLLGALVDRSNAIVGLWRVRVHP
jgi:hypothetical protein